MRSFWLGLTNGRTSKAPTTNTTRRFYQQLNRQSANLALLADISMGLLGSGLKRHERISARLGDILSHLYLASATLKRYQDDGRPTLDLPIVEWVIKDWLFQSEKAMKAMLGNFPNRLVALLTSIIIFPFCYHYAPPNDQLDHKLAKIMMTPSETRDCIGLSQYLTPSEHNPHGLINTALLDIIAAEPIFERLVSQNAHKPHFINLDKLAKQS